MKRLLLVTLVTTLVHFSYGQNYLIANNNPAAKPGTNVFTGDNAILDALAAATANDIIFVVPSNTSYTGFSIDIPIKIYGIGLNPTSDGGKLSRIQGINIRSGDVLLSGLDLRGTSFISSATSSDTYTNITFENSRVERINQNNSQSLIADNLLVKNCIFFSGASPITLYRTGNAVFTNNIIYTNQFSSVVANTVRFDHNLFIFDGTGVVFNEVDNCFFNYNIFYGTTPQLPGNSTGNTFDYNLSFGSGNNNFDLVPAQNNNGVGNVISDPLFANVPLTQAWSDSYDVTLSSGSAAINIDGNGTDAGPAGGVTPWNPEGTALPLIQSLRLPGTIVQGSDLQVEVQGTGN